MRAMAVIDDAEPLPLIDLPEPTAPTREALRPLRAGGGPDGWVLLRILACGVCMARSYARCWGQPR